MAVDLATGRTVLAKNPAVSHPPASTAKLVTALVVVDRLPAAHLLTVSRRAASQPPSKVGLRAGEKWKAGDLLYALLLESGNDVAVALAEAVSGSEAAFAKRMTETARRLGATRTRFGNASGLPHPDNRTCAEDMALLAAAAVRNPAIRRVLSTREATIWSLSGRRVSMRSHNRLLWDEAFDVVGKTGYTRASRKCFAGVFDCGERTLAVAVLGSGNLWGDLRAFLGEVRRRAISAEGDDAGGVLSVRAAQRALAAAGYDPGPVDGILGSRTRAAMRRFQHAEALVVDGRLGPETSAALRPYLN